ncbi:MAG: ROK family protein [Candidatus Woesearchaeota archaeon]
MFKLKKVLVADIGGTNCTLAILNKDLKIIVKKKYSSQQISNFGDIINNFLRENKCKITDACFGVAGPINDDGKLVKGTNIHWTVNIDVLKKETKLKRILLINDFEAIGHAVNTLDVNNPEKIKVLNPGKERKGPIVIIGAGTGLGVSYLIEKNRRYLYMVSEGGHSTMVLENKDDYDFREFLKNEKKISNPDLEDSLSGRGISNIFDYFLKYSRIKIESSLLKKINDSYDKSATIAMNASKDKLCSMSMQLFIKYYARAVRNIAVTFLPAKIFIAGGIASKNMGLFLDKNFLREYTNHKNNQLRKILSDIPIYAVLDYEVSLYGCANAILNYQNYKDC